ncbi:MAG: hypothetical protein JWN77_1117 [Frankiales bacterium]|jgi:hypothetical protein|nr:hypothetical protein [Frankiales bacterium]
MAKVDNLIERRIHSVQFGLLGGLVMVIAGPEAADLASSVGTQSSVLGAAVGARCSWSATRARAARSTSGVDVAVGHRAGAPITVRDRGPKEGVP